MKMYKSVVSEDAPCRFLPLEKDASFLLAVWNVIIIGYYCVYQVAR